MKKVLAVMLISLIAIMGFVSCSTETTDPSATKSLVFSVDSGSNAKALTRAPESLKADTLFWKYEAKKADNTGFVTGETTTPKEVKRGEVGLQHEVGPFSQGLWNFTLYGYTDSAYKNLAWTGTIEGYKLVVGSVASNVVVDVHRLKTAGVNGIISVKDNLQVKLGESGYNTHTENWVQEVKIAKAATPDVYLDVQGVAADGHTDFTVESGAYFVYVSSVAEDGSIVYAQNKIAVNVYDNLKTVVAGKLDERVGNTIFGTNEVGDVTAQSPDVDIQAEGATDIVIESNIVEAQTPEATATKISLPKGALAEGTKSANVTMVPVTADKAHANEAFTVTADQVVVGALDLKLTTKDASEKTSNVTDFQGQSVTITTIIGKGLTTAPETAQTSEQDRKVKVAYSGKGEQPKTISYDPTTGELVFTTTHFSEFYVTYNYESIKEVMNLSTGVVYDKFADAFAYNAYNKGDTIVLLKDVKVPGSTYISVTKSIVLDGRNHRITVEDAGSGWPGYGLFKSFTGKICNLDYETMGFKALVVNESTYGGLTFDNVDVYGNMDGADSNTTAYLIYINGPYEFKFINCNNHANIIDNVGGAHWGAAFCGLPNGDNRYSISFENCNNYGHISIGQHAAFLIANPTNLKGVSITYTNCKNYGCIEAPKSVGVISWPNSTFTETGNPDEVNAGEGVIQVIAPGTISAFSVAVDGTPTVTCSSGNANLKYSVHFNVSFYFKGTTQSGGNRNITLGLDQLTGVQEGKLPLKLALATPEHLDKTVDESGTLYIDPYAYDMGADEYEYRQFPVKMDYRVADYDPTSGKLLGTAKCFIDEAK